MRKFERIIFFLLLASIPIQLGKHFWPEFSFIQGIRVDYLSPTLYVSDIIFIILFCLSINRSKGKLKDIFRSPLFLTAVTIILIGGILSQGREAAFFGIVKFFEFVYIALYIAFVFKRQETSLFVFLLTLGALVETIILFFQFISQSSLGGPFYFLGERTFNILTPGIATFQMGDRLFMRPYGTFPHPNVLAFYLLFGFTILLFSVDFKRGYLSFLKTLALLFITCGIFLTFSRVIFLLYFAVLYFWTFVSFKKTEGNIKFKVLLLLTLIFIITFSFFSQRFEASIIRDSILRLSLVGISLNIFLKNILWGTGLNNFFYYEIMFQKNFSPTLLQPVHNIYLLWLVQTGILGFVTAIFFIRKTIILLRQKVVSDLYDKKFYQMVFLLFLCCGIIGLFDHYLLTLQQPELIVSMLLGLSYAEVFSSARVSE